MFDLVYSWMSFISVKTEEHYVQVQHYRYSTTGPPLQVQHYKSGTTGPALQVYHYRSSTTGPALQVQHYRSSTTGTNLYTRVQLITPVTVVTKTGFANKSR